MISDAYVSEPSEVFSEMLNIEVNKAAGPDDLTGFSVTLLPFCVIL